MPANEATWRNTQRLHRILAVSGVLRTFKSLATDLNEVLNRWKNAGHAYSLVSVNTKEMDNEAAQLKELSSDATKKRQEADAAIKVAEAALADAQAKPDDKTKQADF